MAHYIHHIRAFATATRHLSFHERAVYRELIDLYFETGQALPLDAGQLAVRIGADTDDLRRALTVVLEEFFQRRPHGWYHERCETELKRGAQA